MTGRHRRVHVIVWGLLVIGLIVALVLASGGASDERAEGGGMAAAWGRP